MSFMDEVRRRIIRRIIELERSIEEVEEEVLRLAREIEREMQPALTPEGRVEPLTSVYEYPDRYLVIIDMPLADLDAVSVEARGNRLQIRARLKSAVRLECWSTQMKGVSLTEYYKVVDLPPDARASSFSVEKRGTRLVIAIPRS